MDFWWDDPGVREAFEADARSFCPWVVGRATDHGFVYSTLPRIDRMGHVQITVQFDRTEPERPWVHSPPLGGSSHRNPGGSMCLWYPGHARQRRWGFNDGLGELIVMAALHLRREHHWRKSATAYRHRVWPGPEMPHGHAWEQAA